MQYFPNIYIKILFIINFLLRGSEEQFIENPKIILNEFQYPVILNGDNQYYYIITSGNIHIVEKLTGNIILEKDSANYSPPYFLCEDESKNHFLLADKEYFKINLDSNFENINLNLLQSINKNFISAGCIKQFRYNGNDPKIGNGEIIVYGRQEDSIYFYYINKKKGDLIPANNINGNDNVSCKLINNVRYMCGFFNYSRVKIDVMHLSNYNNLIKFEIDTLFDVLNTDNTDNLILFDTKKVENKFLCYKRKNDTKTECYIINILFNDYNKRTFGALQDLDYILILNFLLMKKIVICLGFILSIYFVVLIIILYHAIEWIIVLQ